MRAGVIETPTRTWQARVLPLNYARSYRKISNLSKIINPVFMPPRGIEPLSWDPESHVLSIELRRLFLLDALGRNRTRIIGSEDRCSIH